MVNKYKKILQTAKLLLKSLRKKRIPANKVDKNKKKYNRKAKHKKSLED